MRETAEAAPRALTLHFCPVSLSRPEGLHWMTLGRFQRPRTFSVVPNSLFAPPPPHPSIEMQSRGKKAYRNERPRAEEKKSAVNQGISIKGKDGANSRAVPTQDPKRIFCVYRGSFPNGALEQGMPSVFFFRFSALETRFSYNCYPVTSVYAR